MVAAVVVVGAAVVVGGGSSGGGGGGGTARVTGGGGGSPAQLSADLFLPGTGNRTHLHSLPSKSTVQGISARRRGDPRPTQQRQVRVVHDEPPEPFEHDGQDVPRPALFQGRRRLEAQQHYGFHTTTMSSLRTRGVTSQTWSSRTAKRGSLLSLVAGKPLSWFLQVPG